MSLISIDGMGGDGAPEIVIRGLSLFRERCPKASFLVYGNEHVLRPLLAKEKVLRHCTELIHTPEAVDNDMKSLQALRGLSRCSMRLALEAVASGEAQGVVSAGNTGAYMALCSLIFQPLEGIHRPAIVSLLPTQRGESAMLDLGGNLKASAQNLVDYGIMGDLFARHILGLHNPSIGLLNVGRERHKGTSVLREAHALLSHSQLNFQGFVEGDDIGAGTVDVIVTDGFTGNVALKTGEGIMRLVSGALKTALQGSWRGRLSALLAAPLLREMKQQFDPRVYNGALWLGFKAIAVKSHGGTDALGFAQAVEIAYDMIQANITTTLESRLQDVRRAFSASQPASPNM